MKSIKQLLPPVFLFLVGLIFLFSLNVQAAPRPKLNQFDASALVINEVDVDTPGTDIAEFIEIFDGGTGNTALTGYVIVLYNGSNDQSYLAMDLDGYQTDANGYLVIGNPAVVAAALTFPDNTLQQGADAIALYQANAADFPNGTAVTTVNLIDAFVYDTNDADDVGLLALLNAGQPQVNEAEAGSASDHSSQRCANGSGGQRNTTTFVQIPPSPGATNNCNAVEPTSTPMPTATPVIPTPTSSVTPETGLLINEVDADTPSTDTAEYVEIYDGGSGNTPLDGLALVFYDGADDEVYLALDLDGMATNADGYFVAGNSAVASAVITFADSTLQNGADAVALYIGSASDFPVGTALTTVGLLDALVYSSDDPADAGLLTLLLAGQTQMNEAGARNADAVAMGRCPNGDGGQRVSSTYALVSPSPNEPNNCGSTLPTLTPTATPSAPTATPTASPTATIDNATPTNTPVVSGIFINEVDADSEGSDTAEFVELYGPVGAALDGLCFVAINGSNDRVYLTVDLDGAAFNSSGFYVIGNAAVPNVGLTFADNALQNGPDAVAIIAAGDCGATISSSTTVTELLQLTLVDAIVYGTNDADDAELLALLSAGQPQLNEDGGGDSGAHSNARCPNGGGATRSTANFSQLMPSPGSANPCPNVATPTPTATPQATPTLTMTATMQPALTATPTLLAPTVTPSATVEIRTEAQKLYLPVIQR